MKRVYALVIIVLFFIWILPLGFFIKPSQEQVVCNGQRAICLCSHLTAKKTAKNAGEKVYKGSEASQKEQNGSGGANHKFLSAQEYFQNHNQLYFYPRLKSSFFSFSIVRCIEHVPKADS